MTATSKTLIVPSADGGQITITVLAQIGQCVISEAPGYIKCWSLTHIRSGHSVILIPKAYRVELKDMKELAQALKVIDFDAFWLNGRRDRGIPNQAKEIINHWGRPFGYDIPIRKAFACDIRPATESDVKNVKRLSNGYKTEIGYVMWPALRESVERGTLLVTVDELGLVGFCNYRQRRDGWHTIYEIAVNKDLTRRRIGTRLLEAVPLPIRLKCPVEGAANLFYERMGFKRVRVEAGKKRPLNVWEKTEL